MGPIRQVDSDGEVVEAGNAHILVRWDVKDWLCD